MLLLFGILAFGASISLSEAVCSPKKCPSVENDKYYTVHLVPHSHMDIGWLKTVDQYFFGTRAEITTNAVQYIYDSVLSELQTDPQKRFMFVETGFFELWWNHRDNATRQAFKNLVMNGQIEFVSGGYSMNDAAATHYINVIDQMTYGLGILKELFGDCGICRVGWQIDPFGHSREFSSLLAQMGFKGIVINRIDYQDKSLRMSTKRMEFNWKASSSLAQSQLTGVILYNHYSPPSGFCFDEGCSDEIIVEDKTSEEYNAPKRAQDLMNWLTERATYFATNNLIVTLGDDFNYMDAHKWMVNIDAMIRIINGQGFKINNLPVRLVYSTPSCYLQAMQDQKLETKTDDFFPYANGDNSYWTGYFTSRPVFKYLDRISNNFFQAAKQLTAMAGIVSDRLGKLRRSLAIIQHHDAITGTAKQHVNNDYTKLVSAGLDQAEQASKDALSALATGLGETLTFCRTLNISKCDELNKLTDGDGLTVTVYNPSSQKIRKLIRIPITAQGKTITIANANGDNVDYNIAQIPQGVVNLAERSSNDTHELLFYVDVNPLDFTSVDIRVQQSMFFGYLTSVDIKEETVVERGGTTLRIDPIKGLTQITMKNITVNVNQGYFFYKSSAGKGQNSGAYVFKNDGPAQPIPLTGQQIINGDTIIEIRSNYSNWVSDSLRLTNDGQIEYDWVIGPIPVDDKVGKEIIWRIQTDIASNADFFTDSNARENLKRTRNFRPTWNVSIREPVAGNYYPINAFIKIQDQQRQLGVFTDRSVGGTSLASGQLEIMLHRRCLVDDGYGVGEPLNEPGFDGKGLQVRGTHRIALEVPNGFHRLTTLQRALSPIIAFSANPILPKQNLINVAGLPSNVQVLTLEKLNDKDYLVRLENIFERQDNPRIAVVDLNALFLNRIQNVRETLLAVNIDTGSKLSNQIQLYPMQIRTFVITLNDS